MRGVRLKKLTQFAVEMEKEKHRELEKQREASSWPNSKKKKEDKRKAVKGGRAARRKDGEESKHADRAQERRKKSCLLAHFSCILSSFPPCLSLPSDIRERTASGAPHTTVAWRAAAMATGIQERKKTVVVFVASLRTLLLRWISICVGFHLFISYYSSLLQGDLLN
jgi:hypothetical protein